MPCSDSTACYAIVQPKALNQGYVLSKNGSGVWYRADGDKLMKQVAYNNQYLSVSDNIALLAFGYDSDFFQYFQNILPVTLSLNLLNPYAPDSSHGSVAKIKFSSVHEWRIWPTTVNTNTPFYKESNGVGYKVGADTGVSYGDAETGAWYSVYTVLKYSLLQ